MAIASAGSFSLMDKVEYLRRLNSDICQSIVHWIITGINLDIGMWDDKDKIEWLSDFPNNIEGQQISTED